MGAIGINISDRDPIFGYGDCKPTHRAVPLELFEARCKAEQAWLAYSEEIDSLLELGNSSRPIGRRPRLGELLAKARAAELEALKLSRQLNCPHFHILLSSGMRSVASDEISGTGGEICKDCGAVIARIEAMKRGTRYE